MSFTKFNRLVALCGQSASPRYHISRLAHDFQASCIRFWSSDANKTQHESEPQISKSEWIEEVKNLKSVEVEIYRGPLAGQVRRVKLFSLMTSIAGICSQPVILKRAAELEASSGAIFATCSVVGFFTFITPILLHVITKKYVISVSHNPVSDTYTATIYSLLLRKRKISFKPGEAEIPDVSGLTSAKIRGIPLFIDSRFFDDVYHYKRIMGFDKPMDFKLGSKKELT